MHEKTPQPEIVNYQETVDAMAAFFGISNLSITMAPGKGWSCKQTDRGIEISVDPLQLIREKAPTSGLPTNEATNPVITIRPEEILHTTAHEIGHARDILDGAPTDLSQRDNHFFWNIIHDSVIDARLRHIPLLNTVTTDLYEQVLFPESDVSTAPAHVQFMYGVLLSSAVSELPYTYSPQVKAALDSLINYQLTDDQEINILHTLTDIQTDIPSRLAIAKQFIMPLYKKLLTEEKQDNKNSNGNSQDFSDYYDGATKCTQASEKSQGNNNETNDSKSNSGDDSSDGDSGNSVDGDDNKDIAEMIAEQMQKSAQQNKEAKQATSPKPNGDDASDKQQKAKSHLAGMIKEEMQLSNGSAEAYAEALMKYRWVISQTADIFLKLSSYADTAAAHRYQPRAHQYGRRLHPTRLATAAIQSSTRHPESIWQPTEVHSAQQELIFGGLDIHLIVDVSGSMDSASKSESASACSIILLEALDLAVKRAESNENDYVTPDVRTQIIAFGSGSEVLSNLSIGTTSVEKGKTFHNLRHACAGSTYVNDSLELVQQDATHYPSRDHIAIIITDGSFSDFPYALKTAQHASDNLLIIQLNIDCESTPITDNNVEIESPSDLPHYLLRVLQNYLNQYES